MSANHFDYDPSKGFSMDDLEDLMKSFSKPAPKQFHVFTDTIGSDLMSGDPKRIANAKRKLRIDQIGKYRRYIELYGAPIAKTLAILDKQMGHPQNPSWSKYLYTEYKTIKGSEEGSFVKLIIDFKPETKTFSIRIMAGYDYYGVEVIHNDIVSPNVSYKSVFNQINYFTNKFKAGTTMKKWPMH